MHLKYWVNALCIGMAIPSAFSGACCCMPNCRFGRGCNGKDGAEENRGFARFGTIFPLLQPCPPPNCPPLRCPQPPPCPIPALLSGPPCPPTPPPVQPPCSSPKYSPYLAPPSLPVKRCPAPAPCHEKSCPPPSCPPPSPVSRCPPLKCPSPSPAPTCPPLPPKKPCPPAPPPPPCPPSPPTSTCPPSTCPSPPLSPSPPPPSTCPPLTCPPPPSCPPCPKLLCPKPPPPACALAPPQDSCPQLPLPPTCRSSSRTSEGCISREGTRRGMNGEKVEETQKTGSREEDVEENERKEMVNYGEGGGESGLHDCCVICFQPCSVRRAKKLRRHAALRKFYRRRHHKVVKRSINSDHQRMFDVMKDNVTCNNKRLMNTMLANLVNNSTISKRQIQKAAEWQFKRNFNVICSNSTFSFVTHTDVYCQVTGSTVTCYAFMAT